MRSHSAILEAWSLNSFWYLDRSVAHRVMISSIVLFFRRGSWEAGPVVDAESPAGVLVLPSCAVVPAGFRPPNRPVEAGAVVAGAAVVVVVAAGAAVDAGL